MAAAQGFDRHVQHRKMIRHEKGVELRRFELEREGLQARETEVRIRVGSRIAPGTGVQADGPHEGPQMKLPCRAHPDTSKTRG